jgi:6-pyruvoyltetrahydropterin/6-carboxytetrahydropterin synthase
MIYITRKEHFNAAHKLYREEWSVEKNEEVFGRCANANWHGHNYDLFVTIKGQINPETGFVVDLKDLKDIILTHVVDKLDHRNLNLDVDFMKGKMASTEVLAIEIWKQLEPHIIEKNAQLHCIKLYETASNFVEYFGENG